MENGKIYPAMIAVLKDTGAITKDKKNQQQGYSFRGIDDVYNTLHPLFAKHGIFVSTEVSNVSREERATKSGGVLLYTTLDLKVSFYAEDGSNVSTITRGEAMDSADKSTNKAMSAALKYAIMQTFLIPTEELIDADATTPEPTAPEPKKTEQPQKQDIPAGDMKYFMDSLNKAKDMKEMMNLWNQHLKFAWTPAQEEEIKAKFGIRKNELKGAA